MLVAEYDYDLDMQVQREESYNAGIQTGMQTGIQTERLSTASRMKKANFTIPVIQEMTGLSKEEIEGEAAKHACYYGSNRDCDERQGDFSEQHSSSSAHSGDSALQSADFYEQCISCSEQRISYSAHILLWLMSCRVLKRDMEYAMMDALVMKCKALKIKSIYGYYYPTAKNHMVEEFYGLQGFEKIKEDEAGNTVWKFDIADNYENKNKFINVKM